MAAVVKQHVESFCERVMTKRAKREFLASVGPFLLVVTFIEDGLRIFLRWSEQMHYMTAVMRMCACSPRRAAPRPPRRRIARVHLRRGSWTGMLLLLVSAAMQLGSSALVLRPQVSPAAAMAAASHRPSSSLNAAPAHAQRIKPSRVKPACYVLLTFVGIQPFMYGQVTDVVRSRAPSTRGAPCGARRFRARRPSCAGASRWPAGSSC